MKPRLIAVNLLALLPLCLCFLTSAGCSREKAQSKPLPTEVVVSQVQQTFDQADTGAKELANDGVAALKNNEYTDAVQKFQILVQRPDLTQEQRKAANQAFGNTLLQISQAAANGDPQAQKALKYYMMTK